MSTFADMQVAVDRGAVFCDIVRPGWADDIDYDNFDFGAADTCIVGQLFDYSDLYRNQGYDFLIHNGFTIPRSFDGWFMFAPGESDCTCCGGKEFNAYDVMNEMWKYKIRKAEGL